MMLSLFHTHFRQENIMLLLKALHVITVLSLGGGVLALMMYKILK
jgi:hypothetical protein